MKPVLDTMTEKLENLRRVLESHKYPEHFISEVRKLESKLSTVKAPTVPPRVLWDKYALVLAVLEEAVETARKGGEELAVYSLIVTLREGVEALCSLMRRAYYVERAEMMLPSIMAVFVAFYKVAGEGFEPSWYLITLAVASVLLTIYKPIAGLALLAVFGAVLTFSSTAVLDSMAGLLLIVASMLYIYLLNFSSSANFKKKLSEVSESIYHVVRQGIEPRSFDIEKALNEVKSGYSLPDEGIFKYIDKEEVLRYKAFLMHISLPRISAIKGSREVDRGG